MLGTDQTQHQHEFYREVFGSNLRHVCSFTFFRGFPQAFRLRFEYTTGQVITSFHKETTQWRTALHHQSITLSRYKQLPDTVRIQRSYMSPQKLTIGHYPGLFNPVHISIVLFKPKSVLILSSHKYI